MATENLLVCVCGSCGQRLRYAKRDAGKTVVCPRCRQHVEIPSDEPVEPGTPFLTWALSPFRFGFKLVWLLRFVWLFIFAFAIVVITFRSPIMLAHYPALVLLGISLIGLVSQSRSGSKALIWACGILALVGLIAVYYSVERYDAVWVAEDGVEYHDIHRRLGDQIIYRTMRFKDPGDTGYTVLEGPMVGRTKPHGEWVRRTPDGQVVYTWVWYGDVISEGEWHEKNRD